MYLEKKPEKNVILLPTEYKLGCGTSVVLKRRKSKWQVNLALASASGSVSAAPWPIIKQ